MDPRRPKVAILGTRFRDFDIEQEVLGDVDVVAGPGLSREEILDVGTGAAVILAGAAPVFDAETLDGLGCRAIVRLGVGVDGIDLEKARSLGMWVTNVPDYGTEAVALHAVTLLLASLRKLTLADRRLRSGSWGVGELRPLHLPAAMTAGVIGFGRIGRRVAAMLAGLGFGRLLVVDPAVDPGEVIAAVPGARLVEFQELISDSDVVTLHAPPGGARLLGREELTTMKEGSILVNTARSALVDTTALATALAANRPGMAALDVYDREPPDLTIFEPVLDRLILTPHMSWYTEETELALRRQAAAEASRILASKPPLHPVVAPPKAGVG